MFRNAFRSLILIVLVSMFASTAFADSVDVTLSDGSTLTIGLGDTAQDETLDLLQNGEIDAGMIAIRWMGSYAGDDEFGQLVNDEFGDQVMAAADELIINGDTENGVKLQEQFEQYSTARNAAMDRKAAREAEKAEREAAEQAAEEERLAEEKADRASGYIAEIKDMSYDESLAWIDADTTGFVSEKIEWLSSRWVSKFNFTAPDSGATTDMIFDNLQTQVTARNARRELLATINGQLKPLQTQINAGAVVDTTLASMVIALTGRVQALEEWQPTVDSRLAILLDGQNEGRVNIAACLEALKYAKYNSADDDENAGLVLSFLRDARRSVETVEFPALKATDDAE